MSETQIPTGGAVDPDMQQVRDRLSTVRHKIIVLSGKGGVGKSTVAVNLAVGLQLQGLHVGLLDVDIHGPTVPTMLDLQTGTVEPRGDSLIPVQIGHLKVMSIGLLLPHQDDAVIWRGPRKFSAIKQFLRDVEWGVLDYLVVDAPPGTGDEPMAVCQLIEDADGAVIVTTPQEVALAAVRRSISFCHKVSLPVIGVVENMGGFVCPRCGELTDIFPSKGGEGMAREMGVPFLGKIPLDPRVGLGGDQGRPVVASEEGGPAADAIDAIVQGIVSRTEPTTGT